jgi:hypothetical protein
VNHDQRCIDRTHHNSASVCFHRDDGRRPTDDQLAYIDVTAGGGVTILSVTSPVDAGAEASLVAQTSPKA